MERNSRRSPSRSSTLKIHLLQSFYIFFSLLCIISSTTTNTFPSMKHPFSAKAASYSEGRRFLRGVGSSPPRCTSKCGKCTPCKPVHVPVPPGTPVTTEYYPEAWRCKCGNRLYMP